MNTEQSDKTARRICRAAVNAITKGYTKVKKNVFLPAAADEGSFNCTLSNTGLGFLSV